MLLLEKRWIKFGVWLVSHKDLIKIILCIIREENRKRFYGASIWAIWMRRTAANKNQTHFRYFQNVIDVEQHGQYNRILVPTSNKFHIVKYQVYHPSITLLREFFWNWFFWTFFDTLYCLMQAISKHVNKISTSFTPLDTGITITCIPPMKQ